MKLKVISLGECKDILFEGRKNLLALLQENGYKIKAACAGNGTCGKCKVKIIEGNGEKNSLVLACKTEVYEDGTIEVFENKGNGLDFFKKTKIEIDEQKGYGIAMDLGTTTIAYNLVNLENGKILDKFTCLNPQGAFGADVISRIKYATENNVKILQNVVLKNINETIKYFSNKNEINIFEKICVAGNTTMLNILLGEDISGIGRAPFTAKVLKGQIIQGNTIDLELVKDVILLPSQSAFVGGDVIVGSVVVNQEEGNNIFVDIGTNGEIIISNNGEFFCSSTAAGPCFEGAKIECGMGGCQGAIDHVEEKAGKIVYSTIGNVPPVGICGSGLIDAIALMLNKEIIDSTGAFDEDLDEEKFYISENVYISGQDIREFQLAKSAIESGIEVLSKIANLDFSKTDNLFVAGGLGFYINMDNAVRVGLLPKELKEKIKIVGNTALKGAYMSLLSKNVFKKAQETADNTKDIELSTTAEFSQKFMENILFED